MPKIETSVQMESAEGANRLHGYLMAKDVAATITDGARVVVSSEIGEATLVAAYFFDFLNER